MKTTDLIARGSARLKSASIRPWRTSCSSSRAARPASRSTDNAVVVVHVKEKQDVKPEEMSAGCHGSRRARQQHRGQFFAASMVKAKDRMTLTYNSGD